MHALSGMSPHNIYYDVSWFLSDYTVFTHSSQGESAIKMSPSPAALHALSGMSPSPGERKDCPPLREFDTRSKMQNFQI